MNEKFAHTPGRLWVECGDEDDGHANQWPKIRAESHEVVGAEGFYGDIDEDKANARRIAACWNALDGVPTEHLESLIGAAMAKGGFIGLWSNYCDLKEQRADLLEALQDATDALAGGLWDFGPGQDEHEKCNEVIAQCRAVIAKATGKTSEAA